jgi:hypothetical protein
MSRVFVVMALAVCLVSLVAASPVRADTTLFQEDFEEASAGNPGTAVVDAGSGWTGSTAAYLSNWTTFGAGNSAEWRYPGGTGVWHGISHSFSNTPGAGDTYTLTGTLYVPGANNSTSSLTLADSAAENQYIETLLMYKYGGQDSGTVFKFMNGEGGSISVPVGPDTANGDDVKIVVTSRLQSFYYRSNGTTEWTSAGSLTTSLPLSTYQAICVDFYQGYPGAIDSIKLTTSAVPEPTTLTLVITGLVGLLAYVWRKRS